MDLKRGTARVLLPVCLAAALAALVLSVYQQVGAHDFVNIDDNLYIYENPVVLRGLTLEGISWAFTTFHAGNWHPLTWLSHMLDAQLFGPSPGWHHRMNLLYHLLNVELLFFVLWRMTGGPWQSAFAAALFGVHPLHVESVAWAAERKDVLSTLFWILATGAYVRYLRRPAIGRYLAVASALALGLLAKPMPVTLPFALLLLDFWPLGRTAPPGAPDAPALAPARAWARPIAEKLPLLALSAASCVVTHAAQSAGGSVSSLAQLPLGARLSNALVSYPAYLWKAVWPSGLAVFYPHPATVGAAFPAWKIAGAALLLALFSAGALRLARRAPSLAVGWLWYLGTLIPVIGLVQVGSHAIADRYTYVPLIGISIAVAWGIRRPGQRAGRLALAALAVAALVSLAAAARVQAGYWRDGVTLFARAVAVTGRDNWFALNNLGMACGQLGRHGEAIGYLDRALRVNPVYSKAWYNLGVSRGSLGQYREAVDDFRRAVRIENGYARAWYNMGVCYERLGMFREAAGAFREAARIDPSDAEARANLAEAERRAERLEPAEDVEATPP